LIEIPNRLFRPYRALTVGTDAFLGRWPRLLNYAPSALTGRQAVEPRAFGADRTASPERAKFNSPAHRAGKPGKRRAPDRKP
jgi:hypothetical protein